MNLWRALAVATCIAVIVAVLWIALAVQVAAPQPIACMPDDEMRDKVRAIMLQALDEGFKAHIEKTFEVWMRDDRDQPRRATTGVRNGIRAYVGARGFVLKWDPPKC